MKKNILLLESVSADAMTLLENNVNLFVAKSPYAGIEIASTEPVHGIITRGKGDVSQELIQECPNLEVIARCGVGLDNVNVNYATKQGVFVVNAPGTNAATVAEHTLALMLMLQRNLFSSIQEVKQHNWDFRKTYQGDEIRGKTLGILGFGDIGQRVAKLADAFGMYILYHDRSSEQDQFEKVDLEALLSRSDIISLHLPLTDETKHLINAKTLGLMRDSTILINTARGAIIDQRALYEALENGRLAGFGADVLATEPPEKDEPLLQLPNVLITPHSASLTATTYNQICTITVQNAIDVLAAKKIDQKYIFNFKQLN